MTEADQGPITGTTVLTQGDHFGILRYQVGRAVIIVGLVMTILFLIAGIIDNTGHLDLARQPVEALWRAALENWPMILGSWIGVPLAIVLISTVRWMRFPNTNRDMRYRVDGTGVIASDAAGVSLQIPWSMVKHSRRTKSYILMRLTSGGLRCLPWRAFSTEDAARLWQLVSTHTRAR